MKIHFLQKVLKGWSSFRKKLLYFIPFLGGVRTQSGIFFHFFNLSLRGVLIMGVITTNGTIFCSVLTLLSLVRMLNHDYVVFESALFYMMLMTFNFIIFADIIRNLK